MTDPAYACHVGLQLSSEYRISAAGTMSTETLRQARTIEWDWNGEERILSQEASRRSEIRELGVRDHMLARNVFSAFSYASRTTSACTPKLLGYSRPIASRATRAVIGTRASHGDEEEGELHRTRLHFAFCGLAWPHPVNININVCLLEPGT